MPPIWRRSLTESGMQRRVTQLDRLVVAIFLVVVVGAVVVIVAYVATHTTG